MTHETITLAHGSGGRLTHELIQTLFARYFKHPALDELGDSAVLPALPEGRLAMTTDSYVIQPIFFPGGDIGKLAVCGTVNDLAVAGATPLYLSAGFILEEGLPLSTLERIVASMAETARAAGVSIVAGDTKVVQHGAADQIFITTAGVGVVPPGLAPGPARLQPGDVLLINGPLGDHGTAVMLAREKLAFETSLQSDCAPLSGLIGEVLRAFPQQVHWMRDVTRGGLATVLCEWAEISGLGLEVREADIPIRPEVHGVSEFLGLDPLYIANEGKVLLAVAQEMAEPVLALLRAHPLGRESAIIGQVTAEHGGRAVLRTPYGSRRILQMLTGAQLPRIC